MKELLLEKKAKLDELRASDRRFDAWIDESDLWYWIYTAQRISAEPIEKRTISDVLSGHIVESAPIYAYDRIIGYSALRREMDLSIGMGTTPDLKLTDRWFEILFKEKPKLRSERSMVYEWELYPPYGRDVPAGLKNVFASYGGPSDTLFAPERATLLHYEFLRLYPYGRLSFPIGFALMCYALLQEGYPLPLLPVGDREYNEMAADYFNGKNTAAFSAMLERSLVNRMDAAIALYGPAKG